MNDQWELLRNLSDQRMSRLQEAEQVQLRLDELRLDFAKKAAVGLNLNRELRNNDPGNVG